MEREVNIGRVNAQEPTPKSKEEKFQNTIAFLKTAIAEGAHLKIPFYVSGRGKVIRQISQGEWVRQKNIIGTYFGSPAALEDIGITYGITKQRVKGIKDRGIRYLLRNCSLETQALFPFEELALDKPRSQRFKERVSRLGGGVSIYIRDRIALGKSMRQIRKEGEYSNQQVTTARRTLRRWGIEASIDTPHSKNLELEKNLKKANTDQEKQELLNQVRYRFYSSRIKGNDPLLIPVEDVVKEVRLNMGWQRLNLVMFYTSLKNAGFPMGEIHRKSRSKTGEEKIKTYHFLLAKDKERAKQILIADPNLQRFRRS